MLPEIVHLIHSDDFISIKTLSQTTLQTLGEWDIEIFMVSFPKLESQICKNTLRKSCGAKNIL